MSRPARPRTFAPDVAMENIQQLALPWLGKPPAYTVEPPPPPPELPDRERVHRLAHLYHGQLRAVKHDSRAYSTVLRQQTEALRQFSLELTAEQAEIFMNMYTEESSAVERKWKARASVWRPHQPLPPALLRVLTFAVTVAAIALAIYYAI